MPYTSKYNPDGSLYICAMHDKADNQLMNIKLLTGDSDSFMPRAINIMDLYDQANGSETNFNLKIKRMLIIFCENDNGGLLLDYHHREEDPNASFYRLMFAGFEKHNRRKGYLRGCMEFAKNNNINIPVVEFDGGDQIDMWKKFGYSNPWRSYRS